MQIRFGECILDTEVRALRRAGQRVHLTPKAFQLLLYLVEVRPRAVSKSELQDKLWPATFVSDGNLAGLVKEARLAIGDEARQPRFIRTVHGFGYAFAGAAGKAEEKIRSLLILPFDNATGDRDLDYLCDGIAENIANAFSRLASFRVLSPRTAVRWKGSGKEPDAIGRQLEVETVVCGRLVDAKASLNIQVDAVEVASGTQLWGNRFRVAPEQLFRTEEDVTAEVVNALSLRLSEDDRSRLAHRFTSNPHAYDLYLRGRFHWNRRTEEGLRKALEYFEKSVISDLQYALPYSGIADVYTAIGSRDLMPPREAFARALQAAGRALELAPALAEAHASLGAIAEVHQWDWGEAGRKYRLAIDLSPSYASAHQWYALHFARQGRSADAEARMSKALELDPLSVIGQTNAALIAYLARDFRAASERIERALEIEPGSLDAIFVRGGIREATGDLDGAVDDYRNGAARSPRYTIGLGFLGHALARRGECRAAEEILERLDAIRSTQYISSMDSALVMLGLGRYDEAFDRMRIALRDRSSWMVYLKTDPRLDRVRGDDRLAPLLDAIGFEAANS